MKDFSEQAALYVSSLMEKVSPKDRGSLERIVAAGEKVMFSKDTHQYMVDMLDQEGDLADKLGHGAVQLIKLLMQQSNGTMPPVLVIPAASLLLLKACEFVEKTDGGMTMEIFSAALKLMIAGIREEVSKVQSQPQEPQQSPQSQAQPQGLIQGV